MKVKILAIGSIIFIIFFMLFYIIDEVSFFNKNNIDENSIRHNIEKRIFDGKTSQINEFIFNGKVINIANSTDNPANLIISDSRSNQGILLTSAGKIIQRKGKTGEAPWENMVVKYVDFAKEGYYTFDFTKQMIKAFSSKDSLKYYYKSKGFSINHVVRLKDDLFLASYGEGNNFSFQLIDIKTKKIIKQQSIKKKVTELFNYFPHRDSDLVFEGYFSKNSNGQIVYSCNKSGLFFLFDSVSTIKGYYRTIDGSPLPKPIQKERGQVLLSI